MNIASSIKTRFFYWLGIIAVMVLASFKSYHAGIHLNTNIMDLLPKTSQSAIVNQASNLFSSNMSKQLVFLIGSAQKTKAEEAADEFYQRIKASSSLQSVTYQINAAEQKAWGSFYFPHRFSLLTAKQKQLLTTDQIKQLQQEAMFNLYSPMGVAAGTMLFSDPWFLFQNYLMSLPNQTSKVSLSDQRMMVYANGKWYVMLAAQLKDDSFSITNQNRMVSLFENSKFSIEKQFPDTSILMSGMLFYNKFGADAAQHDISVIGVGSVLGIILLCLLTFKSLKPLIYILLSALTGFIAAWLATQYVFGTIYLFTLILGASLIGICVDYAFFYFSDRLLGGADWNSSIGLKNIFSGISLGLINIVIAYAILAFTPFPGLRQLAVFAITGLIMAYTTVVCFFPFVLKDKQKSVLPLIPRLVNKWISWYRKLPLKAVWIIYLLIAIVALSGIYRLQANDDIRVLENVPARLTATDNQIKQIIGSDLSIDFYVIDGDNPEQTLENEHKLISGFDISFPAGASKYLAINAYIPSLLEQKENFDLVKNKALNDDLIEYLQQIGVEKAKAAQVRANLANSEFNPVTIDAWLQSPVSKAMRFLWLGKIEDKYISIVLLSNKLNRSVLNSIAEKLNFAHYINKADEISKIFKTYRIKLTIVLFAAYLALFTLLAIRYPLIKAGYYFLPPASASLLSLGVLGWIGIPLTLFSILALVLILGIASDYVIFFAETKTNYQSAMLATLLSAIATILSFGLLAFSSTPVIHYLGVTVLVGISSALLLAPLICLV